MKSKLKVLIPIIILLIIVLVGIVIVVNNTVNIELKKEKFVYEYGEDISINVLDYLNDSGKIKDADKYMISSESLIMDKDKFIKKDCNIVPVGEYRFNIEYKNKSKEFIVAVVDTTKPVFSVSKEIIEIEETEEDVNLIEYFEATDLSEVTLTIEGNYNLSEAGEYTLKILATDANNNVAEQNFILKIQAKKKIEEKPVTNKTSETNTNQTTPNTNSNSNSNSNTNTNSNTSSKPVSTEGYRKDIANSYVAQVNTYRKANGKSELPVTTETQAEADRRAKELITNYSHDGVGYGFGEVIGNGTAGGDFITAWKNSPSHNATLLREQNTAIAASIYEYNGRWYAVISFRMDY